jgi:hypothetical protein
LGTESREKEEEKEERKRKKKKVGRNKERREVKGKSLFLTPHSCVFSQPGKHINPSAFTSGNKGTKPDCG